MNHYMNEIPFSYSYICNYMLFLGLLLLSVFILLLFDKKMKIRE